MKNLALLGLGIIFAVLAFSGGSAAGSDNQQSAKIETGVVSLAKMTMECDTCCIKKGDVDNNSVFNLRDITYLINYLYRRGLPPACTGNADANNDCKINVKDVTCMVYAAYYPSLGFCTMGSCDGWKEICCPVK